MNWRVQSSSNNAPIAPSQSCTHVAAYLSTYAPRVASLAVCGTGYLGLAAWLDARWKAAPPQVRATPTTFNCQVLSRCTTLYTPYSPLPFLCYGHVETLAAALLRCNPDVDFRREVIMLQDGGCICLDWLFSVGTKPYEIVPDTPILLLLPGCMAGSQAAYVRQAAEVAVRYGFSPVVFNARGFGGTPVITPRLSGTSGTADLRAALDCIKKHHPGARIFAVGWSLGANLMVKYLGEEGPNSYICGAASLSNVYDLNQTIERLSLGLNRLYDWHLGRMLRNMFHSHRQLFNGVLEPGLAVWAGRANGMESFDRAVTLPTLKLQSTEEYYQSISCKESVGKVAVPILCLSALDDPVVPSGAIPHGALKANPNCIVASTRCGGHLGWISGSSSPLTRSWCDEAVLEFLQSVSVELDNQTLRNKLDAPLTAGSTHPASVEAPGGGYNDDTIKAHDIMSICTADEGSTGLLDLHLQGSEPESVTVKSSPTARVLGLGHLQGRDSTVLCTDPDFERRGEMGLVRVPLRRSRSSFGRSIGQGLVDLAKQCTDSADNVVAVWPVVGINTSVDAPAVCHIAGGQSSSTACARAQSMTGLKVNACGARVDATEGVTYGRAAYSATGVAGVTTQVSSCTQGPTQGAGGVDSMGMSMSTPGTPQRTCSRPPRASLDVAPPRVDADDKDEEDNILASPPATPTQARVESLRWRATRCTGEEDTSRTVTPAVDPCYPDHTGLALTDIPPSCTPQPPLGLGNAPCVADLMAGIAACPSMQPSFPGLCSHELTDAADPEQTTNTTLESELGSVCSKSAASLPGLPSSDHVHACEVASSSSSSVKSSPRSTSTHWVCDGSHVLPQAVPDAAPGDETNCNTSLQYEIWPESATAHRLRPGDGDPLHDSPKFPVVRPGASFAKFSRTLSQLSSGPHTDLTSTVSMPTMVQPYSRSPESSRIHLPPRASLDLDIRLLPSNAANRYPSHANARAKGDDVLDVMDPRRHAPKAAQASAQAPRSAPQSSLSTLEAVVSRTHSLRPMGVGLCTQEDVLPDVNEFLDDWGQMEQQLLNPLQYNEDKIQVGRSHAADSHAICRDGPGARGARVVGFQGVSHEDEIQPCPDDLSTAGSLGCDPTGLAGFHEAQMESIMFGM